MIIWKSFSFDAAHWLPGVKPGHKCAAMHGHTYTVRVFVSGEIDPETGMVSDYDAISSSARSLVESLDHSCLNDTIENPTSENIAVWFSDHLRLRGLCSVEIQETPQTGARWSA